MRWKEQERGEGTVRGGRREGGERMRMAGRGLNGCGGGGTGGAGRPIPSDVILFDFNGKLKCLCGA